MPRLLPGLLVPLAVVATACGASSHGVDIAGTPEEPKLYEANATVLDDGKGGPMLCLGAMAMSLPPQCGDVPIVGWDWAAVDGEERAGGTTWGAYRVVGRYDGETLRVTEVGSFEQTAPVTEPDFRSPCEEPPGGWPGLDRATQNDVGPVTGYASAQAEYVAAWVTHLEPTELEFGPVVVNVVFTRDAERHEAAIRQFWEGPLCVVERDVPSARELARVRREAEGSLEELGLQMLWSDGPGLEPVIEIGVVADPDGHGQAAFDDRYGAGLVRVVPALQPVS
jgi:hypothetical protein